MVTLFLKYFKAGNYFFYIFFPVFLLTSSVRHGCVILISYNLFHRSLPFFLFLFRFDCGFFMLKFLELWDGCVSPAITFEQIPALRKLMTARWLEHAENKLKSWKTLLDSNVF